jgi:hypothetical protein
MKSYIYIKCSLLIAFFCLNLIAGYTQTLKGWVIDQRKKPVPGNWLKFKILDGAIKSSNRGFRDINIKLDGSFAEDIPVSTGQVILVQFLSKTPGIYQLGKEYDNKPITITMLRDGILIKVKNNQDEQESIPGLLKKVNLLTLKITDVNKKLTTSRKENENLKKRLQNYENERIQLLNKINELEIKEKNNDNIIEGLRDSLQAIKDILLNDSAKMADMSQTIIRLEGEVADRDTILRYSNLHISMPKCVGYSGINRNALGFSFSVFDREEIPVVWRDLTFKYKVIKIRSGKRKDGEDFVFDTLKHPVTRRDYFYQKEKPNPQVTINVDVDEEYFTDKSYDYLVFIYYVYDNSDKYLESFRIRSLSKECQGCRVNFKDRCIDVVNLVKTNEEKVKIELWDNNTGAKLDSVELYHRRSNVNELIYSGLLKDGTEINKIERTVLLDKGDNTIFLYGVEFNNKKDSRASIRILDSNGKLIGDYGSRDLIRLESDGKVCQAILIKRVE